MPAQLHSLHSPTLNALRKAGGWSHGVLQEVIPSTGEGHGCSEVGAPFFIYKRMVVVSLSKATPLPVALDIVAG